MPRSPYLEMAISPVVFLETSEIDDDGGHLSPVFRSAALNVQVSFVRSVPPSEEYWLVSWFELRNLLFNQALCPKLKPLMEKGLSVPNPTQDERLSYP